MSPDESQNAQREQGAGTELRRPSQAKEYSSANSVSLTINWPHRLAGKSPGHQRDKP